MRTTATKRATNRVVKVRSELERIRERVRHFTGDGGSGLTPAQRDAGLRKCGVSASRLIREAVCTLEGLQDFEESPKLDGHKRALRSVLDGIDKMTSECPAIELWDTEAAAMRRHLEMVK